MLNRFPVFIIEILGNIKDISGLEIDNLQVTYPLNAPADLLDETSTYLY